MAEVKLNCYTIQIRERRQRNQEVQYLALNELSFNSGNPEDRSNFSNFFRSFIESFDGRFKGFVGNETAVFLPPGQISFASDRRIIYGFMQAGRTGMARTIREADNPDEEVFNVTPDHVDSNDYFFMIWYPDDSNIGLLIVQGFSTESASEIFKRLFIKFFNERATGQIVEIARYIPSETVEQMRRQGEIDKIVLTKQRVSPDAANSILGIDFIASDITIEIKIKGLRNYTDQIKDLLRGSPRFFTTEALQDVGMDGSHDISVEYEFNGKKATAKQSSGFQLAPFYYVDPNSISNDPITRLPTKESIQAYCFDFLEMIINEMRPNRS